MVAEAGEVMVPDVGPGFCHAYDAIVPSASEAVPTNVVELVGKFSQIVGPASTTGAAFDVCAVLTFQLHGISADRPGVIGNL